MSKLIIDMNHKQLTKLQKVKNHVVHHGSGSVHLTNYLEDENYNSSQDSTNNSPLPYQEEDNDQNYYEDSDSSSSDSENSGTTTKTGNTTPIREQLFNKSPGLKKRFVVPLKKAPPVITPQAKVAPSSTNKVSDTDLSEEGKQPHIKETTEGTTSVPAATNDANNKHNQQREHSNEGEKAVNAATTQAEYAPKTKTLSAYTSPYLHKMFRPKPDSLNLLPELESLTPLLLSQHEALTQYIKDLGSINLTHTKSLEKKKNNFQLLKDNKKIPRSLRIKCELTTSPNFANDTDFLQLKDELHQVIDNCIKEGTTIITNWAEKNIKLLTLERAFDYLKKALQILEGLTSFFADTVGYPLWPSVNDKHLTLFMLKTYLSDTYIEADKFAKYLDLPLEKLLLLGAKILLDTESDETAEKVTTSLKLSDINMAIDTEEMFVTEVLVNFDQILTFTTTGLWHCHLETSCQTTAGLKLKSKMKAMEIMNATMATAQALEKATEIANIQKTASLETNLRITNLEKSAKKQEQKSNEIINQMKAKTTQTQKNLKGSRPTESATSPDKWTPLTRKNKTKRNLVDLTLEEDNEVQDSPLYTKNKKQRVPQKNTKGQPRFPPHKQKAVQWKETKEVTNYHPNQPVSQSFTPQINNNPFKLNDYHTKPTFFQNAPTPPPPPHYILQAQNPNQIYHINNTGLYPYQSQYQAVNNLPIPNQNPFCAPENTQTQFLRSTNGQHNPLTYANPFVNFPSGPNPHPNKN